MPSTKTGASRATRQPPISGHLSSRSQVPIRTAATMPLLQTVHLHSMFTLGVLPNADSQTSGPFTLCRAHGLSFQRLLHLRVAERQLPSAAAKYTRWVASMEIPNRAGFWTYMTSCEELDEHRIRFRWERRPGARRVATLQTVKTPGGRNVLVIIFRKRDPSALGHAGAGKMLNDVWVFL